MSLFVPELDGFTLASRSEAYEAHYEHSEYVALAYGESMGAVQLPYPVWDPYGENRIWSREYGCWMERDPYRETPKEVLT